MKLFDLDWSTFLQQMPTWDRLSLTTRRAFSRMKPNQGVGLTEFGEDLPLLVDSRWLTLYTDGRRARLHKDRYVTARVIRAMCRNNILVGADVHALCSYLCDHFTTFEREALCTERQSYYADDRVLAYQVLSVKWLEDFLAVKDATQWEAERAPRNGGWGMPDRQWEALLNDRNTLQATQTVIQDFMASAEPRTFQELPSRFAHLPRLGTALLAGIRYLLLFPVMRLEDMTPLLTLWPSITKRLHRPKPTPPESVTPDQTFQCAFLMEDMTTAIIAATAEPLRIRGNDGGLFAKTQKALESELMTLPEWVARVDDCSPTRRLRAALAFLRQRDLLQIEGTSGRNLRFEPTARAEAWLALSSKDRLKDLLSCVRYSDRPGSQNGTPSDGQGFPEETDFEDDLDDDEDEPYNATNDDGYPRSHHRGDDLGFLPDTVLMDVGYNHDHVVPTALASTYGSLSDGRFVPLTEFVSYHGEHANPLLEMSAAGERAQLGPGWGWRQPTEEELEGLWAQFLVDFLRLRLLPLGGAALGVNGKRGAACITLTDVGRYLLGLAEDFDYGHDHPAQVVVQPNFDVVFLSPSPLAEAAISRFAERTGKGIGTLFKITKKSILIAANNGKTAEHVIDAFRDVTTHPLPPNVEHEIKEWCDQCRTVTLEPMIVIRCPDSHTASRVMAVGGGKVTSINETLVELADSTFKAGLIRKLRDLGVFVEQSSWTENTKAPRRRGRRRAR